MLLIQLVKHPELPIVPSDGRSEFIPCFHSRGWEEIGGRGSSGTIVNPCLTDHDFFAQGGHLSANDGDRLGFATRVDDESRLVIPKDKLPSEREGLDQEYQTVQDNRKNRR